MKKKLRIALSVFITIILFRSLFIQVLADGDTKGSIEPAGLSVKVENGFSGEYKIGYYCPFMITIDNSFKDFSGEIQLAVPNDYVSDNLYAIKADISKGSKETFKVDLPIFNYLTRIKLTLVEGKNTVYEKNVIIKPGVSTEMLLLGVLSDSSEGLGYFSNVYDGTGTNQPMKIVRLDENNFPESSLALQAFNGIVINDFDTTKLNAKQYEALKQSVDAGMGLLIGTGGFSAKTFGLFTDDFIKGSVGAVRNVNTTGLSDIAKVKVAYPLNLEVADVNIEGARAFAEKDGLKLIQEKTSGKGNVLIAAFDLGNIGINNWGDRQSFSNELLKRLFDYRLLSYSKGVPVVGLTTPYYLDNFLRNIPELPRPNFLLILGLLALYIVLVAPVAYIVLKKLDKREFMWFIAPLMGVLFAFVIFIAGSGSRLNEPLVNYINIMEAEADGNASVTSFASVFSPDRRDITVSGKKNEKLIPMLNVNNDPGMSMETKDRKISAKITMGEKSFIEYKDNGVGSTRILSINGSRKLIGGLKCEVNRSEGDFKGTITNQTGMDLEGVLILFKNSYIKVDKLKIGETHIINEKQNKTYTDYWQMLNEIFPDPYSIKKSIATMSDAEVLKVRTDFQRRQIIEGYSQTMGTTDAAKVFAFSGSHIAPQILINGKNTKNYEKTVIIGRAEVSYKNGNSVFIPSGVILPKLKPTNISSGVSLNIEAGFLYGNGADAEIYYEIDKKTKVTELMLSATISNGSTYGKPMVPGNPGTPGITSGTFKEFIWDYKTEKWVSLEAKNRTFKGNDIMSYLGNDNVLQLRYETLNGDVTVPQISVKGTVE